MTSTNPIASPDPSSAAASYGLPFVGRYGLGHSLLAWARCELWCKDHQIPMLSPNWNHLRIGPYLRREPDKREYHRLFTFPHYVTGLKRAWLLWSLPKVPATSFSEGRSFNPTHRQLIVFQNRLIGNFQNHFQELEGRAPELQFALRRMTKPRYLPDKAKEPHIAIHVRLGDFSNQVSDQDVRKGVLNSSLPIRWYVHTLQRLRAGLGREVPAVLYSDGRDEALRELLTLPHVRRAKSMSAVTDMLAIAQGSALISSGSGFSLWGCFLGSVPRLCFPGQRIVRVLGASAGIDLEPEIDFEESPSTDFLDFVSQRLRIDGDPGNS